jgi:putative transposase
MTLPLLYLLFCQVLRWLALLARSSATKNAELLVLRHADRAVLAGLVRLLPRRAWRGMLVQPTTLLRWHQDLIRRRWTYPTGVAVPEWRRSSVRWCCGWAGRTRPGGIAASTASCAGSDSRSGPAPCGPSSDGLALTRHRRGRRSLGGSSCGPGPPVCWRWTSCTVDTVLLQRLRVLFVIEVVTGGSMCSVSHRSRWGVGGPAGPQPGGGPRGGHRSVPVGAL